MTRTQARTIRKWLKGSKQKGVAEKRRAVGVAPRLTWTTMTNLRPSGLARPAWNSFIPTSAQSVEFLQLAAPPLTTRAHAH